MTIFWLLKMNLKKRFDPYLEIAAHGHTRDFSPAKPAPLDRPIRTPIGSRHCWTVDNEPLFYQKQHQKHFPTTSTP